MTAIIDTYPLIWRNAPKDAHVDPSTCYTRECVSYCAWKIKEATGRWLKRTGDMNAKNWTYRLPENGYREVPAPRNGGKYIGVITRGQYGHVVAFERDNIISEYNWDYSGRFNSRVVNLSHFRWFEIVAPKASAPAPAPAPQTTPSKNPADAVDAVIRGDFGNGEARANALRQAGFDPSAVQQLVNQRLAQVAPQPTPAPAPQPAPNPIRLGDTVIVNGAGTASSNGTGAATQSYHEHAMKVIAYANGRFALNQYNQGTVGTATDVTGWWPEGQVRKA